MLKENSFNLIQVFVLKHIILIWMIKVSFGLKTVHKMALMKKDMELLEMLNVQKEMVNVLLHSMIICLNYLIISF